MHLNSAQCTNALNIEGFLWLMGRSTFRTKRTMTTWLLDKTIHQRSNNPLKTTFLIITHDHLIFTMAHPDFIVCSLMRNSIGLKIDNAFRHTHCNFPFLPMIEVNMGLVNDLTFPFQSPFKPYEMPWFFVYDVCPYVNPFTSCNEQRLGYSQVTSDIR